jgi:hypothetical protein
LRRRLDAGLVRTPFRQPRLQLRVQFLRVLNRKEPTFRRTTRFR